MSNASFTHNLPQILLSTLSILIFPSMPFVLASSIDKYYPTFCEGFVGAFCDDFEDGNNDGWSVSGGGTWSIVNGWYRLSNLSGGSFSLAGDENWSDYVIEADFRKISGRDVIFHVRQAENGDAYSIVPRGWDIVLIKYEYGSEQWREYYEYDMSLGVAYHISISAIGDEISVSVDDNEIFAYTDAGTNLTNGRIVIGGGFQVDVEFDNVIVYDNSSGAISGSVLAEADGQPIDEVRVDIVRNGTLIRSTRTDDYGQYYFTGINPDIYDIDFTRASFQFYKIDDYQITTGQNQLNPVSLFYDYRLPYMAYETWTLTQAYCADGVYPDDEKCSHITYVSWDDLYALDFAAPSCKSWQKPMLAIIEGTVYSIEEGYSDGWGNNVILQHRNGYQSRYCHLERICVNQGEEVKQGQVLGLCGNTGYHFSSQLCQPHSGTHIHLSLNKDGVASLAEPISNKSGMDGQVLQEFQSNNANMFDMRESTPHEDLYVLEEFGSRAEAGIEWLKPYIVDNAIDAFGTPQNIYILNYDGGPLWDGAIVYDGLGGARQAYIIGWETWNRWQIDPNYYFDILGPPITNSYRDGSIWRQDFMKGYIENGDTPQPYGTPETPAYCPGWIANQGWIPKMSYLFAQVYEENGGKPVVGRAVSEVIFSGGNFIQYYSGGYLGDLSIVHNPIKLTTKIIVVSENAWRSTPVPLSNGCQDPYDGEYFWYQNEYDESGWVAITLPSQDWQPSCDNCDMYYRYWYYYSGVESGNGVEVDFDSDDGLELYVNGYRVGEWGSGCNSPSCINDIQWNCQVNVSVPSIDITDYLHDGYNLIAVHVTQYDENTYFDLSLIPVLLNNNLRGICCLDDGCNMIDPYYTISDCQMAGGEAHIGGHLDCENNSLCHKPESKVKSDPLLFFETALPIPEFPCEITFNMIDTLPHTAYYELPDSLGGDVLFISEFTGSLSVNAVESIHPDTINLTITQYDFDAPSIWLIGLETGINHIRLDTSVIVSRHGYYMLSTGLLELTIPSILYNDIFVQSKPVLSNSMIRGYFDAETGILSAGSEGISTLPYGYIAECGDASGDGQVNLLDILYLISYLYNNPAGPPPAPFESGDVNNDGNINLLDILYLINYLYSNPPGPEPVCP